MTYDTYVGQGNFNYPEDSLCGEVLLDVSEATYDENTTPTSFDDLPGVTDVYD